MAISLKKGLKVVYAKDLKHAAKLLQASEKRVLDCVLMNSGCKPITFSWSGFPMKHPGQYICRGWIVQNTLLSWEEAQLMNAVAGESADRL